VPPLVGIREALRQTLETGEIDLVRSQRRMAVEVVDRDERRILSLAPATGGGADAGGRARTGRSRSSPGSRRRPSPQLNGHRSTARPGGRARRGPGMKARQALGGSVGAVGAACCAPPIIAALGLTVGLAAVAGLIAGIATAVAVALIGLAAIGARRQGAHHSGELEPVPVAVPRRRSDPARRPESSPSDTTVSGGKTGRR
jgi:hypothetical protein